MTKSKLFKRALYAMAISVFAVFFAALAYFLYFKQFQDAKSALLQTGLRDPSSVQFRNIRTVSDEISNGVCGEYNAKNAYGGYVGFKMFHWRKHLDKVVVTTTPEITSILCRDKP